MSSHPDCIFEINQLWQSGFSRVYSNCCCGCSFQPEIIKTGQSSPKMNSNKILNFQASMTILNACTKKVWKRIEGTTYIHINSWKQMTDLKFLLLHSKTGKLFFLCKQMMYRNLRIQWGNRHADPRMRLLPFHITLMPMGEVWIQVLSLQLWVK